MCYAPVNIKNPRPSGYGYLQVPCGKCFECRAARSAAWSFRLEKEDRNSSESHFVTLTYADNYLPIEDGLPVLDKADLQKFFKRLRKRCSAKVKYYACGEYGGTTWRPHYHAIIFNASVKAIEDSWQLGGLYFGDVAGASIRYVTNYLCKSVDRDLGSRPKEFAVMSKGLGKCFIESPAVLAYYTKNVDAHVVREGGVKMAMPRYYKQKLFDDYQRECLAKEHELRNEKSYWAGVVATGSKVELERRKMEGTKQKIRSFKYLEANRKTI